MKILVALLRGIDYISEWSGKLVSWLVVMLMLALTYEVISRYAFGVPTKWAFDISWMLGGSLVLMGAAYVLLYKGHVRVDVIYARFPPKAKLIIDLFFTVVFFFPLMAVLLDCSVDQAWTAWLIKERSSITFWRPPIYPFKIMIPVALFLLLLQGIAMFIRDLFSLAKGREL